ncbi:MAG: Obg family GTPase CgtA [Actinomycetota bacterium]
MTGVQTCAPICTGIDELAGRLGGLVAAAREAEEADRDEGFVIHRPEPEGLRVHRDDNGDFVVEGREALRAVALSDLDEPDAQDFAWSRLRQLGLQGALANAGVEAGSTVHIGRMAFEYQPDDPVSEDGAVDEAGAR